MPGACSLENVAGVIGRLAFEGKLDYVDVYTFKRTGGGMADLTRWTVKVSKETDIALRSFLAERGGKKGDLSKFVEHAVRKEVLRATVRDIQQRNAGLPGDEVQALIDEACAAVRSELWRERSW